MDFFTTNWYLRYLHEHHELSLRNLVVVRVGLCGSWLKIDFLTLLQEININRIINARSKLWLLH